MKGRLTIKLDPNCSFKTESFLIRPHKISGWNETEIKLPTIQLGNEFFVNINKETLENLVYRNQSLNELKIIQNPEELDKIVMSARAMVERANQELKLQEIHYDSSAWSLATGMIGSVSIFGVVATISTFIFYKCNLFGCFLRAIIKRSTAAQSSPTAHLHSICYNIWHQRKMKSGILFNEQWRAIQFNNK